MYKMTDLKREIKELEKEQSMLMDWYEHSSGHDKELATIRYNRLMAEVQELMCHIRAYWDRENEYVD